MHAPDGTAGKSALDRLHRPAVTDPAQDTAAGSYDFSEQIGHLLRKAYQRHLAIFQRLACDPQVTSVQFVTLCALRDHGASTQTDLIRATGIDQATIRGIIERLRKRGLISSSSDPSDRRKVIVQLTPEGEALLERMIPCAEMVSEVTMADLNPAERAALVFTLRKMIEHDAAAPDGDAAAGAGQLDAQVRPGARQSEPAASPLRWR
jgi:MarR family transcriptional regulator, lower aerobic nicotinate degradation pathway regulator